MTGAPRPLLRRDALDKVDAVEGPAVAWLLDTAANWACEDCGAFLCPHAEADLAGHRPHDRMLLEALLECLHVLDATLGVHRSTATVIVGLGGAVAPAGVQACVACGQPWPCPPIAAAETAVSQIPPGEEVP